MTIRQSILSWFFAALLSIAPGLSHAAAAIDTANVKSTDADAFVGGNFSLQSSVTVASSDNFLVVLESNANATVFNNPSSVTYNGVAMTMLAGSSAQGSHFANASTSIWFLANPPTGAAHNLVAIYTAGTTEVASMVAVPMSGVDATGTPFGTPVLATSTTNNSPAVTATGASSTGLYLASMINGVATSVASGANQTTLAALNGDGSANISHSGDTVPGADAGVFSWAGSGTQDGTGWAAVAVPVFAAATIPQAFAPIPINMGTGPNTGTGDNLDTAFPKINTMMGQLFPHQSIQTPVTGFTIAAAAGVTRLVLNPAGTLASGTVTLPPNPGDGQPFEIMSSQAVTAITFTTSDGTTLLGAPAALTNTAAATWRFIASQNAWFRAPTL